MGELGHLLARSHTACSRDLEVGDEEREHGVLCPDGQGHGGGAGHRLQRGDAQHRHHQRRLRPLPVAADLAAGPHRGALLGDTGRYLLASAIVMALGLALGFRPAGGFGGVLAAGGLVLVLRAPSSVSSVSLVIMFPLTLASNVFADPRTMPGWLRAFIGVNPITHVVTAVRGLMDGTATAGQIGWVLLAAAALTAVFAPLTIWRYRRA